MHPPNRMLANLYYGAKSEFEVDMVGIEKIWKASKGQFDDENYSKEWLEKCAWVWIMHMLFM